MECPALFVLLMTQVEVVRIPILCGVSAVFPISACLTIPQQHHTHCSLSNISYMLHRTDMNISDRWQVPGARWQVTGDRFLLQELHSVPALTADLEHVLTEGAGRVRAEADSLPTSAGPHLPRHVSIDLQVTSRWPPVLAPLTAVLCHAPPTSYWPTASRWLVSDGLSGLSSPQPPDRQPASSIVCWEGGELGGRPGGVRPVGPHVCASCVDCCESCESVVSSET